MSNLGKKAEEYLFTYKLQPEIDKKLLSGRDIKKLDKCKGDFSLQRL